MFDADRLGDAMAGSSPVGSVFLPSRGKAREACARGVLGGVALLTGGPGSGKTWLWRTLAEEGSGAADWIGVDVNPSADPIDLTRAIIRALGYTPPHDHRQGRELIADVLWEADRDGRAHVLVLDELHNASDTLLEEVRVLTNAVGRADGFSGVLLCGQTPLVGRLRSRSFDGLMTRVGTRAHLGPLDLVEAAELLRQVRPELAATERQIEERHRWSRGNPGLMLQGPLTKAPRPSLEVSPDRAQPSRLAPAITPVVPSRPAVEVEEGVVEVGWDTGPEAIGPEQAPDRDLGRPSPVPVIPTEEPIHDPYATLQAWEEWTNSADGTERTIEAPVTLSSGGRWPVNGGQGRVWAESEQEFSPFSDLFSRSRTPKDPE